jgi:predicted helicase
MSLFAIQNYYNELQNIKDFGGSKKETAIRFAFQKLLGEYAAQKGLILIAELSIKTKDGKNVTPDGTLKDSLRLDWGYWESKDEADDINIEIKKKFAKGYPNDNILFEDSQTAVLYQNGNEALRIDMKDSDTLDKIIRLFINFERIEIVNFHKAIELFKSDIPNVVSALRNLINEQTGYSSQGIGYSSQGIGYSSQEIAIENNNLEINNIGNDYDQYSELPRSQSLGRGNEFNNSNLPNNTRLSEIGNVRIDESDTESSSVGSVEYSGGLREIPPEGIPESFINSQGVIDGGRNTDIDSKSNKLYKPRDAGTDLGTNSIGGQTTHRTSKVTGSLNFPKPQTQNPKPLNQEFAVKLHEFLETCKNAINPNITQDDINEMMIQHILTADIFNTIFDEPYFHRENNIAKQLETVINTFFTRQIRENLLSKINIYYQAINATAAGIADHHEKQKFLKIVYENFYKSYNPKAADRLGVVYTPNEIVRFKIESIDYLLHKHFGKFLSDKNVEILDPATGTATYICDLIDYLPKDKLEYKYKNEIHANEVAILPYYIANLNIEFTYKQRMGKYEEYKNLCFMDTLDNMGFDYTNKQSDMFGLSEENTERIKSQNERKISVIFGNPPYNANQMNENDNNKNREYPIIDKRIKDTFIKQSTAQKTKLYDMYSRFYRWAMDRLGDEGIIAFITNRSFINSRTFDGFRKIVASEFDHIYIVDLGGDVRSNPKLSGPKHNVFAIQAGVAIMFLVKTLDNKIVLGDDEEEEFKYLKKSLKLTRVVSEPEVSYGPSNYISPKGCKIYYIRRPEMETAKDKLEFLSSTKLYDLIKNGSYEHIIPDKHNNWIELSENNWEDLMPLATKNTKALKCNNTLFQLYSNGIVTARDEWVYDLNQIDLIKKINFFYEEYNSFLEKWKKESLNEKVSNLSSDKLLEYSNNFVYKLKPKTKWSSRLRRDKLIKKKEANLQKSKIVEIIYRPYVKHFIYLDYIAIDIVGQQKELFPNANTINKVLFTSGIPHNKPFQVYASNSPYDFGSLETTQGFPLHYFNKNSEKIENITDWGLEQFHNNYEDKTIIKEDVFHYVYAVLHNPEYRTKYEMNLKREFPRIPFYDNFWKWATWGKKLMDLHINFETVEPYQLQITNFEIKNEPHKPKLKANKETGELYLDNMTTLSGIPKEVWKYKLGNRSALEWILDQYKEKTPKDPTIREKFNTYKFIDYKDKVIDLLMRVTTVSVETVKIIKEMGNY